MHSKIENSWNIVGRTLESRGKEYGRRDLERQKVCSIFNTLYPSVNLTETHLDILLVLTKIARHANVPKEDNLVDIAGYAIGAMRGD